MRTLITIIILAALVGCQRKPLDDGPALSASPKIDAMIAGAKRIDAGLAEAEPEIKDRAKAATLVATARKDAKGIQADGVGAKAASVARDENTAKLRDALTKAQAADKQTSRLEWASFVCYGACVAFLVAGFLIASIKSNLWSASGAALLAGACFSGLAYWGKTIALVCLSGACVIGIAYAWHWWREHKSNSTPAAPGEAKS